MPSIYLSPSTSEYNQLAGGGSEEYYMNLIVDAMIPYLRVSGIEFERNDPGLSTLEIVERANRYPYNLFLALRTQETPPDLTNAYEGVNVLYYTYTHIGGDDAAAIIGENLMEIYPHPDLVRILPNHTDLELTYTDAPAVIVELGNRDNPQDAQWVRDNVAVIAENLVRSITEFFNIPFIPPYEQIRNPL